MTKNISSIQFNFTHEMAQKLIEFNELKKKLISLRNKKILTKEDVIEIKSLTQKLDKLKISFIKEFRLNNKEEVLEYLKIKENS